MDEAEYKHVVLGLIFIDYISDAFEEHYATSSPFKASDWHSELLREDKQWQEGVPPMGNTITS